MQKKFFIIIVLAFVTVIFGQRTAFAQQPQDKCSQITYSKSKTGIDRYRLDHIEGQAVFGDVSEKGEFASASGLCVALFSEKNKRLVATVTTDDRGQFKFMNVASGGYLFIASLGVLHEVVALVQLDNSPARKAAKPQRLLLHMRSKEDRRKSFITLVTKPTLREELLKMVDEDQTIRRNLIQQGVNHPDKALEGRMADIDSRNMARIKEIVKRYGWPGPELVGRDGTDAAFLLIQHAADLAFQKKMLPLVRDAYLANKLSAWSYALLLDRVLARENKPQVYGMSVKRWEGEEPVLDPIEDEANVDKRRAKLGLPPLSEYLEFMKQMHFPQSKDKQ